MKSVYILFSWDSILPLQLYVSQDCFKNGNINLGHGTWTLHLWYPLHASPCCVLKIDWDLRKLVKLGWNSLECRKLFLWFHPGKLTAAGTQRPGGFFDDDFPDFNWVIFSWTMSNFQWCCHNGSCFNMCNSISCGVVSCGVVIGKGLVEHLRESPQIVTHKRW